MDAGRPTSWRKIPASQRQACPKCDGLIGGQAKVTYLNGGRMAHARCNPNSPYGVVRPAPRSFGRA